MRDDEASALAGLLRRQNQARYQGWCWINPPWLTDLSWYKDKLIWSTSFLLTSALNKEKFSVHAGLKTPQETPLGVLLFWPKSHLQGLSWLQTLCQWLPSMTPLEIVGMHQTGIKRLGKILNELQLPAARLDNAKRATLWATATQPIEQYCSYWQQFQAYGLPLISHPGVFAHLKTDEGTQLLLNTLDEIWSDWQPREVIDAGCGNGALSVWCALRNAQVLAIDCDEFALEATRRSLALNQLTARIQASDMLSEVTGQFPALISNPPFHQTQQVDLSSTKKLIQQAVQHLTNDGRCYLVANRFLPYDVLLRQFFNKVTVVSQTNAFQVFCAQKYAHK